MSARPLAAGPGSAVGGDAGLVSPRTAPAGAGGRGAAPRPAGAGAVPGGRFPHLRPGPRGGSAWDGLRIGLYGGSFNPAHGGHRAVARHAAMRLGLDQVWWLVSPQNPLKSRNGMASLGHRMASARAIAGHDPRMVVTSLECDLGTRFTADTLAALSRRYRRTRFVWLMGADNLATMHRWQDWSRIFRLMPIAVLPRAPYSLRAVGSRAARSWSHARVGPGALRRHLAAAGPGDGLCRGPAWAILPFPLQPVSATALRHAGLRWPPAPEPGNVEAS